MSRRGFTLIELLMVVVILLLLLGLGMGLMRVVESTRIADTEHRVFGLGVEIQKHRGSKGYLPAKLEDLMPLYSPAWIKDGRYVDIWDQPFQYRITGDRFELWSCGPDGVSGTADDIQYHKK